MKLRNHIIFSMMLLATGAAVSVSCNSDEEYDIRTGNIITAVETGEAVPTAVSARLTGRVTGLSGLASSGYAVGAVYSTGQDPTATGTRQTGSLADDGTVATELTGLSKGTTYYYATFVTLQGQVTKYGEVKSFTATDAQLTTGDATDVSACKAVLSAQATGLDAVVSDETPVEFGFRIAREAALVETGIDHSVTSGSATATFTAEGLLPATTYYYMAYMVLGGETVSGEVKSFTTQPQEMEYVDLGLSMLWAKCNLGAESETEGGVLAGYADVTGVLRSIYLTDYTPAADISGTGFDIFSHVDIDGGSSRHSMMPTKANVEELLQGTTQTWETVDGVEGMRFTSLANGNSIFIPAAGYRDGNENVAGGVHLWTGTLEKTATDYAYTLHATEGGAAIAAMTRTTGLALRGVRQPSAITPADNVQDRLIFCNKDGDGVNGRIEIYNEYGATNGNSIINPSDISFSKNMYVTFSIAGIDGNMKPDASGYNIAGLTYATPNWWPSYWTGFEGNQYEARINGDGTYTVWMEPEAPCAGAVVFCIEISNLWADLVDPSLVNVRLERIDFDIEK